MSKGVLVVCVSAAVLCTAAESPYGAEVVDCVTAAAHPSFRNPNNVLGEPARFVKLYSGSWSGVGYSDAYGGVVHPVVPAFGSGGLHLSLISPDDENPGYVTIAFDHDVVDDPYNPFGIDFIVFGNSGCTKKTTTGMTAYDDPARCVLTGAGFPEPAFVEVAQSTNGPWYTGRSWRTADNFAPTLGHVYDPDNVDTTLYEGNLWWGAKTDATYPVDPNIDFKDCAGLTLAQLCQRYNGSAGGTGFDLADTSLPADAAHGGRKWFRYVRISCIEVDGEEGDFGFNEPEVDAVADVAPVSGFRLWQLANYNWATVWDKRISGMDAIGANGKKNGLSYILGYSATDSFSLDFRISGFTHGTDYHDLEVLSNMVLPENSGIKIKSSSDLLMWKDELPSYLPAYVNGDGLTVNTLRVSNSGKFFKVSIEE